jgi:hypothetical protein
MFQLDRFRTWVETGQKVLRPFDNFVCRNETVKGLRNQVVNVYTTSVAPRVEAIVATQNASSLRDEVSLRDKAWVEAIVEDDKKAELLAAQEAKEDMRTARVGRVPRESREARRRDSPERAKKPGSRSRSASLQRQRDSARKIKQEA